MFCKKHFRILILGFVLIREGHIMSVEYTDIRTELLNGRFVIISTSGVSMQPLLYDKGKKNTTQVLVEPVTKPIKAGDLTLFVRQDGKYVLHRLIKVYKNADGKAVLYRTRGDNCMSCERITPDNMLGIVTEIYRKGHTIKPQDKGYRIYVKLWNIMFPLRYIWYKIRAKLSGLKNC